MKKKYFASPKATVLAMAICGISLVTGCKSKPMTEESHKLNTENIHSSQDAERLSECYKELETLKILNSEKYEYYYKTFENVMSGAAQYGSVRSNVNEQTQYTVDALYRYKVNLLCSEINQTTLNSFAERGEAK